MTYEDITNALDEAAKSRYLIGRGWQRLPDKTWAKWDEKGVFLGPTTKAAWDLQERLEPIQ